LEARTLIVFGVARTLTRSFKLAVISSVLYALLPYAVFFARGELAHTSAVTFFLLSFLCYLRAIEIRAIENWEKDERAISKSFCLWIFGSGLSLGYSTLIHGDLGMLGLAYVILLTMHSFQLPGWKAKFSSAFLSCALFTLGYLFLFALLGLKFGFEFVYLAFKNEAAHKSGVFIPDMATGKVAVDLFIDGFSKMSSTVNLSAFVIAIFMAVVSIRKEKIFRVETIAPIVMVFTYVIMFEIMIDRNVVLRVIRLLFPLVPLMLVANVFWYHKFFHLFLSRFAVSAFTLFWVGLAAANIFYMNYQVSSAYLHVSYYKRVFDRVSDRVGPEAKILIAPYPEVSCMLGARPGFGEIVYFGENAVHVRHCKTAAGPISRYIEDNKIKYIYIADSGNIEDPKVIKHWQTVDLEAPAAGECYGYNNETYTVEAEIDRLKELIRFQGGKEIVNIEKTGKIYQLF